jgi:hypothetical protein
MANIELKIVAGAVQMRYYGQILIARSDAPES